MLSAAEHEGAEHVYLGLGGSATNDGGFGVARALGFAFLDDAGAELEAWTELERLAVIRPPARRLGFARLTVAVDVNHPLVGPRGATRVFGPQKGLG